METISLDILKKEIDNALEKQAMSGRCLLDRFCLIDERSRKSPPYVDPNYAPFYYYLGKCIKPKRMMEIGFDLGLISSSFLLSCKSVEKFFGFKEPEKDKFFSSRIGLLNIKKVYRNEKIIYGGELIEYEFERNFRKNNWDLVIINEEKDYDKQLQYMELSWQQIEENGMIVVDYIDSHKPSKEAFKSFCESKELFNLKFRTRYGTGIIVKK